MKPLFAVGVVFPCRFKKNSWTKLKSLGDRSDNSLGNANVHGTRMSRQDNSTFQFKCCFPSLAFSACLQFVDTPNVCGENHSWNQPFKVMRTHYYLPVLHACQIKVRAFDLSPTIKASGTTP